MWPRGAWRVALIIISSVSQCPASTSAPALPVDPFRSGSAQFELTTPSHLKALWYLPTDHPWILMGIPAARSLTERAMIHLPECLIKWILPHRPKRPQITSLIHLLVFNRLLLTWWCHLSSCHLLLLWNLSNHSLGQSFRWTTTITTTGTARRLLWPISVHLPGV